MNSIVCLLQRILKWNACRYQGTPINISLRIQVEPIYLLNFHLWMWLNVGPLETQLHPSTLITSQRGECTCIHCLTELQNCPQ